MTGPSIWLAVGTGGALGAMARFAVSRIALHNFGPNFPWGTMMVNISGSFLMGFLVVWISQREPFSDNVRAFLSVGFLGAFTTFSTFSLDAIMLMKEKAHLAATGYIAGSFLLSLLGLLLGLAIAKVFL